VHTADTLLFDEKIPQITAQPVFLTRLGVTEPPSKQCIVPVFFGDRYVEKDAVCPHTNHH
jgi:hypothetical protein